MAKAIADGLATKHSHFDPIHLKMVHFYCFKNWMAINKVNPELLVDVLEYWQINENLQLGNCSGFGC